MLKFPQTKIIAKKLKEDSILLAFSLLISYWSNNSLVSTFESWLFRSIKCCKCFFLSFYSTAWPTFVRRSIFLGKSYIKIFKRKLQITKRTTCDRTLCNLLAFFIICLVGVVWLNVIYLKEKNGSGCFKKTSKRMEKYP